MTTDNFRVKSAYGTRHALATGHHLASSVAEDILAQGGSAIDAMISASAVLTVALPHTSSLGGCAMMVYHDAATQQSWALNGSGHIPQRALPSHYPEGVPQRGIRSCITPALVRFWARAHQRFGSLSWAELLAPAIAYAEEGMPCPEELHRNLHTYGTTLLEQPGFAEYFQPQGQWLRHGQLLRQPALAQVLRTVAEEGEAGFYQGWVAEALLAFVERYQGLLNAEDLAQTQAQWVEAPRGAFQGYDIAVMPPNSVGTLMLEQLELRAQRTAADAVSGQMMDITTAIQVLQQAKLPQVAIQDDLGDTTGMVLMDRQGNALSMLQSIFQPFGSGAIDSKTGFLLNNRLFDCGLAADGDNPLIPGLKPRHTLNPYLVFRQQQVVVAGNSPGGISQTTTGFQVLRALFEGGEERSLGAVVSAPRWSLSRSFEVLLEPGADHQLAQALREKGLEVTENSNHAFYFGSVKIARRLENGVFEVAADMRRQANALAR